MREMDLSCVSFALFVFLRPTTDPLNKTYGLPHETACSSSSADSRCRSFGRIPPAILDAAQVGIEQQRPNIY